MQLEFQGKIPEGYVVYQADPITVDNEIYIGWKMVKQKAITNEEGETDYIDDVEAPVIYDKINQLFKNDEEAQLNNAKTLLNQANQQIFNAEVLKKMAEQEAK